MREVRVDTLVLERGDGTHERVSRDRVVLATTMVDTDTPSDGPEASSTTPAHVVGVPLQLGHPDRGLAELPPPNNGDQSHHTGMSTRLTSGGSRASNPLNRVSAGTPARDFSSNHPLLDDGPVTANHHLHQSSATTSQTATVPPRAVVHNDEPRASEQQTLEGAFQLRRSSRNAVRNNHSLHTSDEGQSDNTPLPTGESEPVANHRDATDLLRGTPFQAHNSGLPNPNPQRTVVETPHLGVEHFINRSDEREFKDTPPGVTNDPYPTVLTQDNPPDTDEHPTTTNSRDETAGAPLSGITPTGSTVGETGATPLGDVNIRQNTVRRRDVMHRPTQSTLQNPRRSRRLNLHAPRETPMPARPTGDNSPSRGDPTTRATPHDAASSTHLRGDTVSPTTRSRATPSALNERDDKMKRIIPPGDELASRPMRTRETPVILATPNGGEPDGPPGTPSRDDVLLPYTTSRGGETTSSPPDVEGVERTRHAMNAKGVPRSASKRGMGT